jgi:hypothetical protein
MKIDKKFDEALLCEVGTMPTVAGSTKRKKGSTAESRKSTMAPGNIFDSDSCWTLFANRQPYLIASRRR